MSERPLDERLVAAAEKVAGGLRPPATKSQESSPALERLDEIAGIARAFAANSEAGDDSRPEPLFLWGSFEVRERLGEGSFGEVFRAWEPGLEREVALKLRLGDTASPHALLAEAKRLAQVRHANVVVVHGAGIHDGRVGLWTDLVEGETLEARLARDGRLSASEATAIGLDLCRALAAIHAAGLIHGDLKPSNVLRERGGRIVIADFGSAAPTGPAAGGTLTPRTGTPAALAPELLAGGGPSAASDLYAVGALLFRLLTGGYPKRTPAGALDSRLLDLRPDLERPLVELVERALEPRPAARFASAGELAGALAGTLEAGPRRAWPRLVGIAAVVGTVVALVVLLATSVQPRTEYLETPLARYEPVSSTALPSNPLPSTALSSSALSSTALPRMAPPRLEATLLRRRGAESTRLASGAAVAPGDHLQLELEVAEPVHVYVLNEDQKGELYLLFPLAGLDRGNPLAPLAPLAPGGAAESIVLPGALLGAEQDWQVTSAGGVERFLVVASRGPNAELEARLGVLERAAPGRALRLDGTVAEAVRGVGGLEPAPASPSRPGEGSGSALDRLERLLGGRDDLRLIRLELANPG